ncbi:MAG TPA: T9SS type A sorting domain-containing protein [Ignavibacteriaceae bacterium]|nr:T9SS type A sorting domain-containing protein [Ignavibacteriaceae bacterium]
MKRTLLVLVSFLFMGYATILGQELVLKSYGVSPRDVARDTIEHYFDRSYNGLVNVGKETKMYFKGQFVDSTLTNPVWTILEKPAGSNAVFGTTKNIDASTQLVTFIPDIVGLYKIEFADGSENVTLTINAGTYLGVLTGTVDCKTCHNTEAWDFKYDKWAATDHATMLQRGLDGVASDHYGPNCISCHAVGYDLNADNDGFDDFPFVFPDSLYPGVYEQMLAAYPDAMARGNIQCESCHGPSNEHFNLIEGVNMDNSVISDNCAWCHDSGTHHFFPEQWDYSKHGIMDVREDRKGCANCHDGLGFVQWVKGGKAPLPNDMTTQNAIGCATCHDPHDLANPNQLRTVTATLKNGIEFTDGGKGTLCVNCHQGRRVTETYVSGYLNNLSSHYGPHYGIQADLLIGENMWTWGESLPSSPHLSATENACIDCHMYTSPEHEGIPLSGGHTFNMTDPDGIDHVEACESCHGNFGEEFAEKKFYINGNADLDGNGVAEGLQHEVHGLLEILAKLLPPYGQIEPGVIDSTWTLDEAAGLYNYKVVEEDRSGGIHNPQFTVALLYLSIEKLGGTVDVPVITSDLPSDYSLAQNYPNPFNPSTTFEYALPTQSHVKIAIYDALGKELAVLVDGVNEAGTHTINWNASGLASGVYFYRMQASDFVQVKKMLLMK